MSVDLKPMNYKENDYGLPKDILRISPSSIYEFTSKKWDWYRSQVLKEDIFTGNTASILGTCIHRVAERYIKHQTIDLDELMNYVNSQTDPEIDKEYILKQLEPMATALLNFFNTYGLPTKSEEIVKYKLSDKVYLAGTYDALVGDILIDFKTTSRLNAPTEIPINYKWQLLAYAYALRMNGVNVNKVRIVWITTNETNRISEKTGKPMKDYPSTVSMVTDMITDDDIRFIDEYLKLITETYEASLKYPKLTYLLYSDYRLKDTSKFANPFNE